MLFPNGVVLRFVGILGTVSLEFELLAGLLEFFESLVGTLCVMSLGLEVFLMGVEESITVGTMSLESLEGL